MMKWFLALTETAPVIAEQATAGNNLKDLPLMTQGLLTTAMGLLGVFLVLTLFFVTIKLMQKIGPRKEQ